MRRRFFLISFLVMLIAMGSIGTILLYYFRNERLDYIDDQIRQTATAIIDSKLLDLKTYDYEEANKIISDELGPDRVGKFFIIRDDKEKILFQTQNIELLNVDINRQSKWVSLTVSNYFVRAANLALPRFSNKTLQVGLIMDSGAMSLIYMNSSILVMGLVILALLLVLTWLLSSYLFSSIRSLAAYIKSLTIAVESNEDLPEMPVALQTETKKRQMQNMDEFQYLLTALKGMVEKINVNRKFIKTWSFQMAHELKTPLTILNRDFEMLAEEFDIPSQKQEEIQVNIHKISETISAFLSWAEAVNLKKSENLYAVHFERVWRQETLNIQKVAENRLLLKNSEDFLVLCNPLHLEQVIRNLLVNALKYSSESVEVEYHKHELVIRDRGEGIPKQVLSRIGSPFNKGQMRGSREGVGLGLAWVKTICEIYDWELLFDTHSGTEVKIRFKDMEV